MAPDQVQNGDNHPGEPDQNGDNHPPSLSSGEAAAVIEVLERLVVQVLRQAIASESVVQQQAATNDLLNRLTDGQNRLLENQMRQLAIQESELAALRAELQRVREERVSGASPNGYNNHDNRRVHFDRNIPQRPQPPPNVVRGSVGGGGLPPFTAQPTARDQPVGDDEDQDDVEAKIEDEEDRV